MIKEYLLVQCQNLMKAMDSVIMGQKSLFGTLSKDQTLKIHISDQASKRDGPPKNIQEKIQEQLNLDEVFKSGRYQFADLQIIRKSMGDPRWLKDCMYGLDM